MISNDYFLNSLSKWIRTNKVNDQDFKNLCCYLYNSHTYENTDGRILFLYGKNSKKLLYDIINSVKVEYWRTICMTNKAKEAKIIIIEDFGLGRHDHDDVFYYTSGGYEVSKDGRDGKDKYSLSKFMIVQIDDIRNVPSELHPKFNGRCIFLNVE